MWRTSSIQSRRLNRDPAALAPLLLVTASTLAPIRLPAAETAVPDSPSSVSVCTTDKVFCATLATDLFNKVLAKKGYRWGGEDLAPPRTVVYQLSVTESGDDVFVPLSAFADLGNPRTMEVKATRRGFDLAITGGDAATSYRAALTFEQRNLVSRTVRHGEFPEVAWEETRYSFNRMKN